MAAGLGVDGGRGAEGGDGLEGVPTRRGEVI